MFPKHSTHQTHQNIRKIEKLYTFFHHAERSGQRFTIEDICKAVGYRLTTANSYRSKKWYWFLHKDGNNRYYSKGLHRLPKHIFVGIHRQKWREIIDMLLALFDQERKIRRVTRPLRNVQPTKYNLLPLLFLLFAIMGWYRASRRLRVRVWRVYLPL